MKKNRALLVFTVVTVIVCVSAIFLPERLAVRQDRELQKLSYSEDISDASVQLSFELTTAQRLNILAQVSTSQSSYVINYDLLPGSNEIQADQCVQVCLDELNILCQEGQAPLITDIYSLSDISYDHFGILNWDNPQEKLLLWSISLIFSSISEKGRPGNEYLALNCLMDAETGTIYSINLSGDYFPELAGTGKLELPPVFAEYLGMELTASETTSYPEPLDDLESSVTQFSLSQDEYSFDFELQKSFSGSSSNKYIWFSLHLK